MAHIGQEAALGAVGGVGGVARLGQGLGVAFQVGDVRADGDDAAPGGRAVLDSQPAVADLHLARPGGRAATGHPLDGPRRLAPGGVGIDASVQARGHHLAEADAGLEHLGQVRVDRLVALIPQDQAVVGVIDAHAVGHGVDGFQKLAQGAAARPPDHPGEEGGHHHGQGHAQGGPQGDDDGAGGLGRQQNARRRGDGRRAHGHEMQPAHAAGGQGRTGRQALPAAHVRQQGGGGEQGQPARHGQDHARRVPGQDGAREAHGVHAGEMHGRDPGRYGDGRRQSRAAPPARIGPCQVQMHGHPEGRRDDHQRQEGLQGIVADGHADVIGQHGDEMGGPDAQAADQGRGDQIGAPRARRQMSGALEQHQGDDQTEGADQDGERRDPPVMLVDQAAQDGLHRHAPSQLVSVPP
ncbi:hypothetical protein D3C77_353970 [compost metagenome]